MIADPSWLRAAGPALTPASALRRLADEPDLLVLHGCGLGWTYVAWGGGPASAFTLSPASSSRAPIAASDADAPSSAWDGFQGGAFIQLDYEFPAVAGNRWPVTAFAAWDPAGSCVLHARDELGLAHLRAGLARAERSLPAPTLATPLAPAWDAAGHRERVGRIRAWIAAGDIYQANLTVPFHGRLAPGGQRDLALFLALTGASPAPFSAFLRSPARSIISHSPECFLSLRADAVASAPIKGTRRRRPGSEAATRADLLAAPKDRAELAMIVDLVRNDLGRVAVPGSVRVATAARVMDLPHVHHLVARVAARLRPGLGLDDVLESAFPAGSITGAPKLRAMQIIHALEAGARGPYCGAFGWVGGDGGAQLAVAIRTLVVSGDRVRLDAGGGIVADSDPASEWDEARAKAAAMVEALGGSV
jgi:anthranilate/para-aminobenzoate synthase component I